MRTKVVVPVVVLIMAMFVVYGAVVVTNVSSTTQEIVDSQMDGTLSTIRLELSKAKGSSGRLSASQIQSVIADFGIGFKGGVFAVDSSGTVVADSANLTVGRSVSEQSWFTDAYGSVVMSFDAEYGQAPVFAHGAVFEGYLLVVYMPQDTLNSYLYSPLYLMGVIGLIALAIVTFLIYLIITRFLILPIEILYEDTEHLLPGTRIDTKPLKRNKQLVEVANSINELIVRHEDVLPIPDKTETVVFADVIRGIIEPLRPKISQKQIKFSLRVSKAVPTEFNTDKAEFIQKVTDLFARAIDFSSQSTAIDAAAKVVKTTNGKFVVEFSVKYGDNIGIYLLQATGGLD